MTHVKVCICQKHIALDYPDPGKLVEGINHIQTDARLLVFNLITSGERKFVLSPQMHGVFEVRWYTAALVHDHSVVVIPASLVCVRLLGELVQETIVIFVALRELVTALKECDNGRL